MGHVTGNVVVVYYMAGKHGHSCPGATHITKAFVRAPQAIRTVMDCHHKHYNCSRLPPQTNAAYDITFPVVNSVLQAFSDLLSSKYNILLVILHST